MSHPIEKNSTVDLLITNGYIVPLAGPLHFMNKGSIAINEGRICAIGTELPLQPRKIIDALGSIVMPGLVNAHMHETLSRGLNEDLPLHEWLEKICFPIDRSYTKSILRAAASLNQLEMIKSGITSFCDIYRYPEEAADIALKSGLRAVFTPQIIETVSGVGETLMSNERFIERWQGVSPRISVGYGPHAPYTCSGQLYQEIARRAFKSGLRMHTHVAESTFELELFREKENMTSVQWLHRLGVLGPWLWIAHGVHLTDEDMTLLADNRVGVVYNPTSNMKLASGVPPVIKMMEKGISLGLGTDSNLSNNNLCMFEEMRVGATLQKVFSGNASVLPCEQMLRMATINGARLLGLEELAGTIEVGKRADIIIVNTNEPHMWPLLKEDVRNVAEQLVYAARASDVSTTIVDGNVLMENRQVLTMDESTVRMDAEEAIGELITRSGIAQFLRQRKTSCL
jgi:5-methylthioadenosine/S-adenosylhomocysteine deaminase